MLIQNRETCYSKSFFLKICPSRFLSALKQGATNKTSLVVHFFLHGVVGMLLFISSAAFLPLYHGCKIMLKTKAFTEFDLCPLNLAFAAQSSNHVPAFTEFTARSAGTDGAIDPERHRPAPILFSHTLPSAPPTARYCILRTRLPCPRLRTHRPGHPSLAVNQLRSFYIRCLYHAPANTTTRLDNNFAAICSTLEHGHDF